MLLTKPGWAEEQPTRRRLVQPYLPWRCVGVSSESPCFLVECRHDQRDEQDLLNSLLVPSPEHLLEVVGQLCGGGYRVYRLHMSGGGDEVSRLELIHTIRSYRVNGVTWFCHIGVNGVAQPCLPWQPRPDASAEWSTEWTCEPVFDASVVYDNRPMNSSASPGS